MSREIKFRVWNNRLLSMSHDVTLYANGWIECVFDNGHEDKYPPKIAKEFLNIMQYTGLKDKNGKEIYEGDVIHFVDFDNTGGLRDDRELKGFVSFIDGTFVVTTDPKREEYYILGWVLLDDEEAEVIGNIYENPELLKEVTK